MNSEDMTPENTGEKKKDVFTLELETISFDTEQVLRRVNANYPTMAVEAIIAQRDIQAGESFRKGIPENDAEAQQVWHVLDSFLNNNAGETELWLTSRVPLDELMDDSINEIEDIVEHGKDKEVPYIRRAFMDEPVTILDLVSGVRAMNIELSAEPGLLPKNMESSLAKLQSKIATDKVQEADAQKRADDLLRRIQGK